MEMEIETPIYRKDGKIVQKFTVKNGNNTWFGIATYEHMNIKPDKLFNLIKKSITDASRGYEYSVIGNINGYRYQVVLRRDEEFKLQNVSKIEIRISDDKSEKIHLSIKIKD
ncbi:MAG: hypothetical protein GXO43_09225 [Crenarchaeota archaeon]|nr:hypothetical protein [Thermoproteota archaeon]